MNSIRTRSLWRGSFALFLGVLLLLGLSTALTFKTSAAQPAVSQGIPVLINELDADQDGTDAAEFIELYDGGSGSTPLDGLVLVLFNGSSDTAYTPIFDLDGYATDADGYFVIGSVPEADLYYAGTSWLQNGADATALYYGDAADFPAGTPITTTNLIDALVYDTDDADDPGLLTLLNPGQPQVNENGAGNGIFDASQRCPDGGGGARNTYAYIQATPTPGSANNCPVSGDLALVKTGPVAVESTPGSLLVYDITLINEAGTSASALVLTDTLPASVSYVSDNSGVVPTNPAPGVYVWSLPDLPAITTTTFQLTATLDITQANGAILTNQANVSTSLVGDDAGNNSDSADTYAAAAVTIYDIQTVADPAADDASPYNGQIVIVEGVVTAAPGEIDNPSRLFVMQDAAGGPWSGVPVFRSSSFGGLVAPEGTHVRVIGTVSEYFGLTELNLSNDPWSVEVLDTVPAPEPAILTTGDFLDNNPTVAEQWEGVLVEFNQATVTDDDLGNGEWHFDDGSGVARADDLGGNDGNLTYTPQNGDTYAYLRGIGYYSFGNYKLEPRSDTDIALLPNLVINELDADMAGDETTEFIELYDGGQGNTPLDGLVVVLYNGSNDTSYSPVFDLDGYTTDADGYFVIGGSGIIDADITVTQTFWLQNGQDAAALYLGDATDFPNGTPVTTTNLVDAIVYDTDDADDPGLLTLLNPGQPQVNENGAGDKDNDANQRCPNGAGGQRNTNTYIQALPTPGGANNCPIGGDLALIKTGPQAVGSAPGSVLVYDLTLANDADMAATTVVLTDTLPTDVSYVSDNSGVVPTNPAPGVYVWSLPDLPAITTTTFQLTATLDITQANGAVLTNQASVSTDLAGDNPANNSDSAATYVAAAVTIYDIQMVDDPAADDASPYNGQLVLVEGVVTAAPGEVDNPSRLFVMQDAAGGPWSGVPVFRSGGFGGLVAPEGTVVRVLGTVSEYNGLTELNLGTTPWAVDVLGAVSPLDAEMLSTAAFDDVDAAISEQWEGVLIAFHDATVTDDDLGFGEWHFDDGSGVARADDLGGNDGNLTYLPQNGDHYGFIRGIGYYSFGNYKLEPRSDADVGLQAAAPEISKAAPVLVAPGTLFTYTITVDNGLGYDLTDAVITDIVPANVAFAYANDAGSYDGSLVTWNLGTLPTYSSVSVSFAVTATEGVGTVTNDQYAVSAGNFITATSGAPVVTLIGGELNIHDIQGAGHVSPFNGIMVTGIDGIVTVVDNNGFYLQEAQGSADSDPATSEAIYVYTGSAPGVQVGDAVTVDGTVNEYYPGGISAGNLPTTELDATNVTVDSSGNPLPLETIIGSGGRIPPDMIIDNDTNGYVEEGTVFDPDEDGLDFYESLEGMLVQVNNALIVGATSGFGEIGVVSNDGAYASGLTNRGGIAIQADDFNPERILIDDALTPDPPQVSVGQSFTTPVIGVMSYSFGNFKLLNFEPLPATTGTLDLETTTPGADDELTIATMNVENLDPGDAATKFDGLADRIVNHMLSPDIIGLQEVQDNNGATNDGTVDASDTYQALIDAIAAAGGPTYDFRDIAPEDNMDGGQPGGNIRVGFLFNPARVSFVDRPGGDANTATDVVAGDNGPELTYSPGRIDPTNAAFDDSRKPLAGEFLFNGETVIVIVNHFNSKGGDQPLFGRVQPPERASEVQRHAQATVVNAFVDDILALETTARVAVVGDLNDFDFSETLDVLRGASDGDVVLHNLVSDLPQAERYTYVYDSNGQVLDHVLASPGLYDALTFVDIVHTNAEYPADSRVTDHDQVLGRFSIPGEPELHIAKFVELPNDPVQPGDVVTFTIILSNTGYADAEDVLVTDLIPEGLICGDIMETVIVPASNDLVIIRFTAEVADNTWDMTITNTASYTHSSGSGSASVSLTVGPQTFFQLFLPIMAGKP
ncbi:MAG: DUF11 domain-containing protein [Ardenticatenales bacterium]|nr:DUF11 domain-containing protein [Ardenticatenales bacterium]